MQFDYDTFKELLGLENDPRMFRVYFPTGQRDVAAEDELGDEELLQQAYGDATRWQSLMEKRQYTPKRKKKSRVPGTILEETPISYEGLTPWQAGEGRIDDYSPHLMEYDFNRPRYTQWWRESLNDSDPQLEVSPREVENKNYVDWTKLKVWKDKRLGYMAKLKAQLRAAVYNNDAKEVKRLYGVYKWLRNTSFERRLIQSILRLPPGTSHQKFRELASKDRRTQEIYKKSRCLTYKQAQQIYKWFGQAFEMVKDR